jgi:type II secretory pathway component PulL
MDSRNCLKPRREELCLDWASDLRSRICRAIGIRALIVAAILILVRNFQTRFRQTVFHASVSADALQAVQREITRQLPRDEHNFTTDSL